MPGHVVPFPAAPPPAPKPLRARSRGAPRPGWSRWAGVRGGRIYTGKDGTLTFYVNRMIAGRHHRSVNLHAHDPETAILKLREWEANPSGWSPQGKTPTAPVYLTPELVTAYVAWCCEVPDGKMRRRNTDTAWVEKKKRYLADLAGQLVRRNLRNDGSANSLTTDDLRDALAGKRNYRHRLEAIKSLYGYLRTEARGEQRIQRHHDPSDAIPIPKPDAVQVTASKVAWSKEDSDKVIRWLERHRVQRRRAAGRDWFDVAQAAAYLGLTVGTIRAFAARGRIRHEGGGHGVPLVFHRKHLDEYDRRRTEAASTTRRVALALRILGGTGWHVREVCRFSRNGTIEELPPDHVRQNGAAKVLTCWHKGGFVHPSPVTQAVAHAAAELQRLGGISYNAIFKWTAKAVRETGAAKFSPGRYRHRTTTFQVNQGAPERAVSKAAGHKSEQTTAIYTTRAVAPKLPTWY